MQLVLHEFNFNNVFAYGVGNTILLDQDRVTQIIGVNGSGKSSIPGALEELFYNKNSRGVKKASIKNRSSSEYFMSATFSIGTDLYKVEKTVKSTTKMVITKNGNNISGHTATLSYKVLEEEIGLDFNTFSKLVYQSMKSSLDFLSATDTNRKKFLIGLLGLEKYSEIEDRLKQVTGEYSLQLSEVEGAFQNTKAWLSKYSSIPDIEPLVEVPEENPELQDEINELRAKEQNISSHNSRVTKAKQVVANAEKAVNAAKDKFYSLGEPPEPVEDVSEELKQKSKELATVQANMATEKSSYQNFKSDTENTQCRTCGTVLDKSASLAAMEAAKERWLALQPTRDTLLAELEYLEEQNKLAIKCKTYANLENEVSKGLQAAQEYLAEVQGTYTEANEPLESSEELQVRINNLTKEAREISANIKKALEHNKSAEVNNAKRQVIVEQLEDRQRELRVLEEQVHTLSNKVNDYKLLTKAFGAKGLVAYKIESSIKALEEELNNYLSVLTAGRFALGFELSGVKLDVVVYDNSELVEINSLSSGEFANVQIATLLAIRKILSAINSVEINVLFLDEVISVIDGAGRDRLISLLLEETELNTFLVSHEYSHPLASKLYVKNDGEFSRITKDI